VVRGGQRIRLTLEGALGKGLHVYAPGAPEEFIPVAWTIEGVKATDPVWPKADKKFQYSRVFGAARDITLPPQLKDETLIVKGTFRYQSCTDRICYPPETVPVEWKFLSESHDRERVPAELRRK
jgi:DsbC/DsbD-like thiol-disulfide interchange protein